MPSKKTAGMLLVLPAAAAFLIAGRAVPARSAVSDELEMNFRRPPSSARPQTWWHWMNGNVTEDGITRDLEAMQRVGLGGFQIFEVGQSIPQGPIVYLSPEWLKLMQHVAREASRLGLQMALHNCPGWSSSGGPWITPELAMQQFVSSETFITGGKQVNIVLPQPFTKLGYYRDAFVLAFPSLPGEERPMRDLLSKVTSGGGPVDVALLTDGDPTSAVSLTPAGSGQPAFLQFEYAEPYEARSIMVYAGRPGANRLTLEASDDGAAFRKVCDFALPRGQSPEVPATVNFAAVRAKYFRLVSPQSSRIAEVRLLSAARIAGWSYKANFVRQDGTNRLAAEQTPGQPAIDAASVLDVTQYVDRDGRLNWQAPPGAWTILRVGHTPVGTQNVAAPDTGRGLECDKFSRAAIDFHFDHMFAKLIEIMGPLAAKGMAGSVIDSYEAGMQNWTAEFPREFQRRRGYDLRRYVPAMTGRVVGSPDISERFLWDVRRTQSDLMAENYYGRFQELCRQHGLKSYAEPYGHGPFDEFQAGSRVDVPMGEFWVRFMASWAHRTQKLASSIAHVYGKPLAGAESFTGNPVQSKWQEYPYSLKAQGDLMYTLGVNQFMFHRYAQQPHPDAAPGMTMGQWGFHFERTNTWWNQSAAWLNYLARCQYMLRQGRFVADLVYFTGEDAPVLTPAKLSGTAAALATAMYGTLSFAPPQGYDYDFANADAILTRMKVEDGRVLLPDGMSYRLLVLPDDTRLSLEVLRKISDMVDQGMWLAGPRPEHSPSLSGYPGSDAEVRRISAELWGGLDGKTVTERAFGKGRVFWGQPLGSVLEKKGVKPDFEFTARSADAAVNYIHRRVGNADVYFVANRLRRSEDLVCTFSVGGKMPEFWDADTGEIIPGVIYDFVDERARVPIRLEPAGSVFVVFRSPAPARHLRAITKDGVVVAAAEPLAATPSAPQSALTNNFTVSVWVKPETDLPLPAETTQGTVDEFGMSFVYFPPEGDVLYGEGHASSGLSAGRNGICVWERVRGRLSPVMVAPMPLSGWTHLAVVYRDGVPSLYVNGKFIRQGRNSGRAIHPGTGVAHQRDDISYFEGDMSEPEVFPEALGEDPIRKLAATGAPGPEDPPPFEMAGGAGPELLIWQNGRYLLRDAAGGVSPLQVSEIGKPVDVAGPWRVSFPANKGAPSEVTLSELASLSKHSDPGVRYFSGTATYAKRFHVSAAMRAGGKRLFLDLGRVEVIAEVRLNGRDLGLLWKPPFRVDITNALHVGDNDLEVRVTNLWPNRLIGDEQLPPENEYSPGGAISRLPDWYAQGKPKPAGARVAFTTWRHYTKDSPLLESSLIGPVRLRTAVRKRVP